MANTIIDYSAYTNMEKIIKKAQYELGNIDLIMEIKEKVNGEEKENICELTIKDNTGVTEFKCELNKDNIIELVTVINTINKQM